MTCGPRPARTSPTTVTALIESLGAKGTASALGATLGAMRAAAEHAGRDAVTRALALGGGERPPGGAYRVVFGPQPIAEILNYMVIPSLSTGAFHAASTAYHGRFGAQVMDARLSLLDDPAGGARRDSPPADLRGAARATHDDDPERAVGRTVVEFLR